MADITARGEDRKGLVVETVLSSATVQGELETRSQGAGDVGARPLSHTDTEDNLLIIYVKKRRYARKMLKL